ncbi:uncharacterized protein LOC128984533 [Macrosteles quadrilineatus]|uniref:uncharacterized protein LOC128984533 n=1 Tax=Macrosteles quadrilineatus TaxID=74068 RepID=UPI0023E322B0|nr:uncharacterized protein LOC128984533 [Macrosteles quadrilineatus]
MATTSITSDITGQCKVNLVILDHFYKQVNLSLLPDLCADIIVGHDILKNHASIKVVFGGNKSQLTVCSVAASTVEPVSLFSNLKPECKPIAIKYHRHITDDLKFIENEVSKLLKDDVIEPSMSPWRAQALVVTTENHRKRMVIDYSRTINRFTLLDAYPLPRIDDIVNKVANYEFFSTIDLKSAYHQVKIRNEEKHYTAFEACGQLYQFKRIPFGVTNGVAAFQRVIDQVIRTEQLQDTYAYLDDVTICGKTQEQHDINLKKFIEAASKYNLTINNEKSSFSLTLGMFSHYASLIPDYATKVIPLARTTFPLSKAGLQSFETIKSEIIRSVVSCIDPEAQFIVETDASESTIAATLTQSYRPVAFFSRILSPAEHRHSSVEKEAQAIVEALRKWRHYLVGKHFKLITDQRSVSFMFDNNRHGKVKNEKIGPLPSSSRNRYLLVIVDEFSRFPFAFPCSDMSSSTVKSKLKTLFSTFGVPSYIHSDRGTSFMSQDLKSYLNSLGISTSRTTAYNPAGNGQVERYNGIVWKTIELALKSLNLEINQWETVLEDALSSVRSLLCTATNQTPHERMFLHPRRSGNNGVSAPSWLLNSGPVYLKRFNRTSKYEPLVEEVQLLHGNAEYAHVKLPDGRETTVSTRHLAPVGEYQTDIEQTDFESDENILLPTSQPESEYFPSPSSTENQEDEMNTTAENLQPRQEASRGENHNTYLRRSFRSRRPPNYLNDYVH